MDLNLIDNKMLILVGAGILTVVVWFLKWFVQKTLNAQFDKIATINAERQKEREYDQFLAFRGQQVTNDCLHELIYAVLHGTHNGGLEKANTELEKFRELTNKNLAEKAAKWNIKID